VDPATVTNEAKQFKSDKALTKLKTSNPNRYYAVLWLAKYKVTLGSNPAGTLYSPQNVVNRGAMAQFMQKLYEFVLLPAATSAHTESYSYRNNVPTPTPTSTPTTAPAPTPTPTPTSSPTTEPAPAKTYAVTFDTQGGSAVASQKVEHGKFAVKPSDPTKAHYTFKGWYTTADGDVEFDFTGTPITSATTIYAEWTINQYAVTFDTQGGSSIPAQTVNYAAYATKPSADPIKAGFVFKGWYTTAGGNTKFNFDSVQITGATTIYAEWLDSLKFKFTGDLVSTATLGSDWEPANWGACEYSADGIAWSSMTNGDRTIAFTATQVLYFSGDCRDSSGSIKYMFNSAFQSASVTAKLEGRVIDIMGQNALAPATAMFKYAFRQNELTDIDADLFSGIVGAPTDSLFYAAFMDNVLTAVPDGLFGGISGAPQENTFFSTFAGNETLSSVGDLGMDITSGTDITNVYYHMFNGAGLDTGVTEITLPAGGPIALFTETYSVTSMSALYTGAVTNVGFGGSGWAKYDGYAALPVNWVESYQVTFNTTGGSIMPPQTVYTGLTATVPEPPTKGTLALEDWYTTDDGNVKFDFAGTIITSNVTIFAHWIAAFKITVTGEKISSAHLNGLWEPANWDACKYSTDGVSWTGVTDPGNDMHRTINFSPTNVLYFKGDCRNSGGSLDAMFLNTFTKSNYPDYSNFNGTVRLDGSVLNIMGNTPTTPVDYMFSYTFAANNITSISEELFNGISGAPESYMFYATFMDTQLTAIPPELFSYITGAPQIALFFATFNGNRQLESIPDGLFSHISGPAAFEMFRSTFTDCIKVSNIGDLGVNITTPNSQVDTYQNMFYNVGTAITEPYLTLPAGGLIALFTNNPAPEVDSLDKLYTGNGQMYTFHGTGWSQKYADYDDIPAKWR
jgi:uncharacterized repeat protein (TIGR02543 family)